MYKMTKWRDEEEEFEREDGDKIKIICLFLFNTYTCDVQENGHMRVGTSGQLFYKSVNVY